MKILSKGKVRPKADNWYWRCPKCHTIGYHETDDGYDSFSTEGWYGFHCPECGERIRDNMYLNRLIAFIIVKCKKCVPVSMKKANTPISVKIVK